MRSLRIEQLYVVERIIGKKMEGGKLFYRIKWQGYPESQSTWEKLSNLRYVEGMVRDFDKTINNFSIDSNNQSLRIPLHNISSADQASLQTSKVHAVRENGEKDESSSQEKKRDEVSSDSLPGEEQKIMREKDTEKNMKVGKNKRDKAVKDEKRRMKKFSKQQKQTEKETEREKRQKKGDNFGNGEASEEKNTLDDRSDKQVMQKREEEESDAQIRIRLIVSEGDSDIHDYYVEYPNGSAKVFQTCEMFYAHPVEFVSYLEKRALLRNRK